MTSNINLAISIIKYLREESKREMFTPDTRESLEVAVQCLQTAYDIDSNDIRLNQKDFAFSLEDIFNSALLSSEDIDENISEELKKAATMKNLGNNLMKSNQFTEAVRYYTAAIELDSRNAIYYGNRAAAYSKLNEFKNAIADCEKAIDIDPKYAKAYGRMGLAYTSLEEYGKAIVAFKHAVELDPDNESYFNNLKLAGQKKASIESSQNQPSNTSDVNIDWENIFTNPVFRNMASTLIQEPSIMTAIEAGMTALNQGILESGVDSAVDDDDPDRQSFSPNISAILETGQMLAAQMQAQNPELAERLRLTRNPKPPNPENDDPE